MVSKFTVFAALAVTLLVASACGHPTAEAEENSGGGNEETTTGYGLNVRLYNKKSLDHAKNCYKRGKEILKWMKKKFDLFKTTTEATTPPPPPSSPQPPKTVTNKPAKMSGYEPSDLTIDGDAVLESVNSNGETSGQVDESPEAGGQVEPAAGDGDSVENPYPISETLSEFADQPTIDVRSTF